MKKLGLLVSLYALLSAMSCEQMGDENSDQKTLDNFATGDAKGFALNQCKGNVNLGSTQFRYMKPEQLTSQLPPSGPNLVTVILNDRGYEPDQATKTALQNAYAALPIETQNLLGAFRIKIRLAKDPGVLCGQAFSKDSNDDNYMAAKDRSKIDTCWREVRITEFNHYWREIVLRSNAKDVGHYLVRQVGYLYSQVFTYLEGRQDVLNAYQGLRNQVQPLYYGDVEDQDIIDMKHNLTAAFLDDMTAKGSQFKLENLNYLLGNASETVKSIKGAQASNQRNLKAYLGNTTFNMPGGKITESQRAKYATGFADYILAEAWDSDECSEGVAGKTSNGKTADTRKRFEQLFPKAWGVWTTFASKKYNGQIGVKNVLLQHSRYLTNIVNSFEQGRGGLRLTTTSVVNTYQKPVSDILGNRVNDTFGDGPMPNHNQTNNNWQRDQAMEEIARQWAALEQEGNQFMMGQMVNMASGVAQGIGQMATNAQRAAAAQAESARSGARADSMSCANGVCQNCDCSSGTCVCGKAGSSQVAASSGAGARCTGCGCSGGCCGANCGAGCSGCSTCGVS